MKKTILALSVLPLITSCYVAPSGGYAPQQAYYGSTYVGEYPYRYRHYRTYDWGYWHNANEGHWEHENWRRG